ncbi:MAG: hypothetical protein ACK55I_48925, partial [bacterium]
RQSCAAALPPDALGLGIGSVEARQGHRQVPLQIDQLHLIPPTALADQGQITAREHRLMARSGRVQSPIQARQGPGHAAAAANPQQRGSGRGKPPQPCSDRSAAAACAHRSP